MDAPTPRSLLAGNPIARLLAIVCSVSFGAAQAPEHGEQRPKIGLVLSGGGARGCAHVGVLEVLEELRIPIDFVTGTSMGAVVGGGYAYGYSPKRLEAEITRAGDRRPWSALLRDAPDRSRQSFRRKQEQRGFLVDFGLGLREGRLRMAKGLIQGQNLELELLQVLADAHDLASFDDLPIPFRAIAVELGTGREVVLGAGNLADALRASMSLPGIFAPAEIDGRELVDGGLVDNVPIEHARALGATRLIVVDIGTPLTAVEIASALDVSTQMVQILTQQNVDRSLAMLEPGDVLIQPDLGDITSSDFERAADSIRIGKQAARAVAERLRAFSVSEAEYRRFLTAQRRVPTAIRVDRITLDNQSGLRDAILRDHVDVEADAPLDLDQLRRNLEELHGRGDFERVTFELRGPVDGEHELVIRAREKSWGPTYLRFGLALESDLEGASAFSLAGQINVREINELGAEWRTDLRLGDASGVTTEFFQPVAEASPLFVAPRLAATTFDIDVFQGDSRVAAFDVGALSAGADVGVFLGTWGEIRVGYTRTAGEVDEVFASQPFRGFDFDDSLFQVGVVVDTLDYPDFPTSGMLGNAQWTIADRALGADATYQKFSAGFGIGGSLGRTTGIVFGRYETAIDRALPVYTQPLLGGFGNLSGLARNQLAGQHLGLVVGLVRHQIAGTQGETLGFPVYVGGSVEAGNVWDTRGAVFGDMRMAGSAFVAVGTPLGPTYVAWGLAEGGEDSFYLFVGRVF